MDSEKILVVEDDLFLRELYTDILTAEGYKVESAGDGEEALSKIKLGGYTLILLDIILPKIDGLEVMRQVKANPPKNPNKCVIFLTNIDKDEEIKTALKLGQGYLIKSQITPGSLVSEVKNYLKQYRQKTI
ncbi:MAG: response regulator [Patescibacteria group bacterium]